jgi:hypothetical protein
MCQLSISMLWGSRSKPKRSADTFDIGSQSTYSLGGDPVPATAFIIADCLGIDCFDVLMMASIPTVLYYLSAWFVSLRLSLGCRRR